MAGQLRRPGSVRLTWIVSYAALIAVPLVVFLLASWAISRVLEDQLADSSATLVDLMGKEIDGKLEYVGRMANDATWNPLTQSLMNQTELSDGTKRFDMVRLANDLSSYAGYNRFGDFFFVHFPHLNSILIPRAYYGFPQFRDTYFPNNIPGSADLADLLSRRHDDTSTPLVYVDGLGRPQQAVLLLKSLPATPSSPVAATIATVIHADSVIRTLHETIKDSRSEIRILNDAGEVLVSTLKAPFPAQTGASIRIAGDSYTVLQRRTSLFGWTVQLLVPDSIIKGKLLVAQAIMVLGLLATLALGTLLTVYLIRRNYGPVRRLVESLSGSEGWEKEGDEFSYIRNAVSKVQERFERNKEPLRENLTGRLLRGQGESVTGIPLEDSLVALDIVFPTTAFVVALVQCEDGSPHADLVRGELEAQLPDVTLLKSSDDNPQVFVLNLHEEPDTGTLGDLKARLEQAGQTLEARDGLALVAGLSSVVRGHESLPLALRQAKTALEYRFVVGGHRPLAWDDLEPGRPTALYHFDLEDESRLMTAVRAGDLEASTSLLDKIFAENLGPGIPLLSPHAVKCLTWDLGASILKALAEIAGGDEGFSGLFEPVSVLAQSPQLDKVRAGLQSIVVEACRYAGERNATHSIQLRSDANRQFIRQVCDYLEAQFRDPSLNLAKVADAQGLTPAYLSRLFRENMEEGILDFLSRVRIENAKNLLKTTTGNLQELGLTVGFTDVKTFIRTFRKFAGTTPGKYREIG